MDPIPKHFLVVDDYPGLAEVTAELLKAFCPFDISVDIALDGAQALALAKERVPELALLDIDMPVMDGLEAAKAMRAHFRDRCPVLVAVTGNPCCLVAMSVRLTFDQVLPKPFEIERLLPLILQLRDRR